MCVHSSIMGRHKNVKQEAIMVNFIKDHQDLAFGHMMNREQSNALWIELANKLNAHGPPSKAAGRWKKVWFDWRSAVKRKVFHCRNGTIGSELENVSYKKSLSPAEYDVALICGFYENAALKDDYYADSQEDLSAQFSVSSNSADGGVINIIKEELSFAEEDDETPLGDEIETLVSVEESNDGVKVGKQAESNINVRSFAQYDEVTNASKVKVEVEENCESNVSTKKRKLNTNTALLESVENADFMQLVKEQAKVINTVSILINENISLHQENLNILKDLRKGVNEMCASMNQLGSATNETLKEQRRHNYEMEKLRREEILVQKQQLQLNEMKVFGKE